MSRCEVCGKESMIYLHDSSGWERYLCRDCHNKELAQALGIENFNGYIRTYQAKDVSRKMHTFEIKKQIYPTGIRWLANEVIKGEVQGYQFSVDAKLDDDPIESLQKLYGKIKKGLSKKYIKTQRAHGQIFHTLPNDEFVGRIEWDEENNGEVPRMIIDGKAYSWYQVGRMLMTYEGWDVELKIREVREED